MIALAQKEGNKDTMLYVFKMDMVDLGALNLTEAVVGTQDGAKACLAP
jgi:hypothetical protein